MLSATCESVWAAAEIDAAYAAILRTIVAPRLTIELHPDTAVLTDLVDLCCLAYGGDRRSCEQVAVAWNLLYTALYLLDGVEDGDLSAGPWAQWGTGAAINLSTGLLATTGALLSQLEGAGVGVAIAQRVRADFYHTLLKMTAGQHHDLTRGEPTLEQCWQIVGAKSGELFGLACQAGALLAGADERLAVSCKEFGQMLGILIQIGDDLDDLWSRPGASSDLVAGDRWKLPVAYAMTVLPPTQREQLRNLLLAAPGDESAEAEARSCVLSAGAALYLAAEARCLYERAGRMLYEAMPESAYRAGLLRLLDQYTPLKDR
ncbi:MAG TPA: polyprenyl synthetase family protein [Herpetosiphonaceae bacterium]